MRERGLERDARKRLGDPVAGAPTVRTSPLHRHRGGGPGGPAGGRSAARPGRPHRQRHVGRPLASRGGALGGRGKSLPATPAEHAAEEAKEAEHTAEQGFAEWEVRVELPSHRETIEFAGRLEAEGIPVVRRWTFLLVGAANEHEARTLAERVRKEAPEGSRVEAEVSGAAVWKVADPCPFAVFGVLGG